ncbi:hypothetical protein ACL1IT_01110 [Corynebacterium striatum]
MTTLDDLTPLQRQELVGTWVDLNGSTQPHIYLGEFTSNTGIRHGARLFNPTYADTYAAFEGCTPRPDLPRAWNPDGTPPAGEWEYAEYLGDYKGMTNVYHYDGEPTHRHFVGEWEEA